MVPPTTSPTPGNKRSTEAACVCVCVCIESEEESSLLLRHMAGHFLRIKKNFFAHDDFVDWGLSKAHPFKVEMGILNILMDIKVKTADF